MKGNHRSAPGFQMQENIKAIIRLSGLMIFLSVCAYDCQCLFGAEVPSKQLYTTKHFSIYCDTRKWKFIRQKEENCSQDDKYIETDLGNALSDPIIGKGSERVLCIPEEELSFFNPSEKINLSISSWPIALWQISDKTKKELAVSLIDAYLLVIHGRSVDIKNSDIKYFENTINNKHFMGMSYVFEGVSPLGSNVHITHAAYCYLSDDLRRKYLFNIDHYADRKAIEETALVNYLNEFLNGFEVTPEDKNNGYFLDYVIFSARSLYSAFRQRIIFEEIDKTSGSIYKIPVNIEQGGVISRRILKSDTLDIRQHPIQERINQTLGLLNEAAKKLTSEPRVYYGLGLIYEFNIFGERYGEGYRRDLSIAAYQDALSIESAFVPARHNLAILYLRNEELNKGIDELEKIIKVEKMSAWEAYCALAYAYEKKNDYLSALSYYKSVLANLTAQNKRAVPDLVKHIKERIRLLAR